MYSNVVLSCLFHPPQNEEDEEGEEKEHSIRELPEVTQEDLKGTIEKAMKSDDLTENDGFFPFEHTAYHDTASEGIIFLQGGRAATLQIAHPIIAIG